MSETNFDIGISFCDIRKSFSDIRISSLRRNPNVEILMSAPTLLSRDPDIRNCWERDLALTLPSDPQKGNLAQAES